MPSHATATISKAACKAEPMELPLLARVIPFGVFMFFIFIDESVRFAAQW